MAKSRNKHGMEIHDNTDGQYLHDMQVTIMVKEPKSLKTFATIKLSNKRIIMLYHILSSLIITRVASDQFPDGSKPKMNLRFYGVFYVLLR